MTTRIYHRIDTAANWNDAIGSPGAGNLAKGEIGIVVNSSGSSTAAIGYLGINNAETPWTQCPIVFFGSVTDGLAEPIYTVPVIYEQPATTPPARSTLSWDAANDKWVVDTEVLNLDSYPTEDGAVAWDQAQGKFIVGASVSAIGIDGGSYTA